MLGGFVFVVWFICPILWGMSISVSLIYLCLHSVTAKNAFYSQYMPISAGESFDNTGNPYNLSAVVTNNLFDQKKYEEYSPLFLPVTYAISYGTIFATYPAILVHTFLWYRHDVVRQFRHSLDDETDIHAHLMRKYPEVPRWWFVVLGSICIILGIVSVEICKTGLPVWAFFFAVIFAMIFVVPFGIIQAITNQQFFLTALSEIIIGYILPGRPIAAMLFKTIASDTVVQATSYCSDLKFGYYLKVPPRLIFFGQVIASMFALLSQIVAQNWALNNIPDICTPGQKNFFICPNLTLFNTSAIIWGGIGPKRLFSPGTM